jgi:lipoprotein-anchoring transpeptidase ErfK/SrfK
MGSQLLLLLSLAVAAPEAQRQRAASPPPPLECGDALGFQVLLDRRGFSPGEIDGTLGPNASRALRAYQEASRLEPTGRADCATWQSLGGNAETTTSYTITDADVAGPFAERIPGDLVEQSKLEALLYKSPLEQLGERFHASPALLRRLNPNARFAAGETITVPAVTPFDPAAKPTGDRNGADKTAKTTAAKANNGNNANNGTNGATGTTGANGQRVTDKGAELRVEVTREGSLRVLRPDGGVEFFAPVTSGSEHDPLPAGEWRVNGVGWMPPFRYNPDLFWDADPSHTKAIIKPGPNNPVGVVWIDINVEHYGLHGTPEPGRVGHAQSHGCVRLTNWDAARLASLVRPGTPVTFR